MRERSDVHARLSAFCPTVILLFLTVLFCIYTPKLFAAPSFDRLLLEFSVLLINTTGLSFIFIGNGIDLSLGAQTALAMALIGKLASGSVPPPLVAAASIAVGLLCGVINGIFSSTPYIASAYATVSTLALFSSVTLLIYGDSTELYSGSLFNSLHHRFLAMPLYFWISLFCLMIMWGTLHFTYFGKYLKALGSNKTALQAVASPLIIRILSYSLASLFFAIQAIVQISQVETVTPASCAGIELLTITATLLSYGIRLPDRGSRHLHISRVFTITVSVAIVSVWYAGALVSGWSQPARGLLIACLLAVSVLLDRRQQHSSQIYNIVRASGTNMD